MILLSIHVHIYLNSILEAALHRFKMSSKIKKTQNIFNIDTVICQTPLLRPRYLIYAGYITNIEMNYYI
jgi:hypothetical protein